MFYGQSPKDFKSIYGTNLRGTFFPKSSDERKVYKSKTDEPQILVQDLDVDDKTRGGIYLPGKSVQEHRNVASIGKVIQMGEDAYNREDMSKPWCELGDHVMFAKYAGHRFQFGKTELRIMNDDEILGLVPDIKNIS